MFNGGTVDAMLLPIDSEENVEVLFPIRSNSSGKQQHQQQQKQQLGQQVENEVAGSGRVESKPRTLSPPAPIPQIRKSTLLALEVSEQHKKVTVKHDMWNMISRHDVATPNTHVYNRPPFLASLGLGVGQDLPLSRWQPA